MESHVSNPGLIIVFRKWTRKASTLPLDPSLKHGLWATQFPLEKAFGFTAIYLSENQCTIQKNREGGKNLII